MLEALLERLRLGRTLTTSELACELGVSQPMVEHMLFTLQRMGYLQEIASSCQDHSCQACPLGDVCSTVTPSRLWEVIPKK